MTVHNVCISIFGLLVLGHRDLANSISDCDNNKQTRGVTIA